VIWDGVLRHSWRSAVAAGIEHYATRTRCFQDTKPLFLLRTGCPHLNFLTRLDPLGRAHIQRQTVNICHYPLIGTRWTDVIFIQKRNATCPDSRAPNYLHCYDGERYRRSIFWVDVPLLWLSGVVVPCDFKVGVPCIHHTVHYTKATCAVRWAI
jgi:hypothetical protein